MDTDNDREICPECGATGCQDAFYQMLGWENEEPALCVVHHLLVLCFYLQHPSRYSPDGLRYGANLLVDFVERGLSPTAARQHNSNGLDSGTRKWKVTARSGAQGAYRTAPRWTVTAPDVLAGGMAGYIEHVSRWARSILTALRESGNLPSG
jgi:hypothetical protein